MSVSTGARHQDSYLYSKSIGSLSRLPYLHEKNRNRQLAALFWKSYTAKKIAKQLGLARKQPKLPIWQPYSWGRFIRNKFSHPSAHAIATPDD